MSGLRTRRWGAGAGTPVLLVHGAILSSRYSFFHQRTLGARWPLVGVDRPGHGDAPATGRVDFEPEAAELAELIAAGDGPAHLVGHSYGAIVALLAAAAAPPGRVLSVTAVEPPAWGVALDDPAVASSDAAIRALLADPPADDRRLLEAFFGLAGVDVELPDPLPEPLAQGARAFRLMRPPGDAALPLGELAAAPFPILVVTGGHSPSFEAVGDRIAEATGARREVLTGRLHLVQDVGAPFNELLAEFLTAAETARAGAAQ